MIFKSKLYKIDFLILWYKAKEILRKKKEKEKSISRKRAL